MRALHALALLRCVAVRGDRNHCNHHEVVADVDGTRAVRKTFKVLHGPRTVDVRDHLVMVAVVAITSHRDASKQRERGERTHYRCLAPAIRVSTLPSVLHPSCRSPSRVSYQINKVLLPPLLACRNNRRTRLNSHSPQRPG